MSVIIILLLGEDLTNKSWIYNIDPMFLTTLINNNITIELIRNIFKSNIRFYNIICTHYR